MIWRILFRELLSFSKCTQKHVKKKKKKTIEKKGHVNMYLTGECHGMWPVSNSMCGTTFLIHKDKEGEIIEISKFLLTWTYKSAFISKNRGPKISIKCQSHWAQKETKYLLGNFPFLYLCISTCHKRFSSSTKNLVITVLVSCHPRLCLILGKLQITPFKI